VDLLVAAAEADLLASAHDVSDGGLAVALAESAMPAGLGAEVVPGEGPRPSAALFGESTGRAVVSCDPASAAAIEAMARAHGVPFAWLGRVGGERVTISAAGRVLLDEDVAGLKELWSTAFERAIAAADVL
jgi:phosphoribosylformylglycinamidine synthase